MSEVYFTVQGAPRGKARPRVTKFGTYTPKSTKEYEALVQKSWQAQTRGAAFPENVALSATIHAHVEVPKSYSKKKRADLALQPCCKKPDCDNIAKAVLDALNGCAYPDDNAIAQLIVLKTYTDAQPYVSVRITDLFGMQGV